MLPVQSLMEPGCFEKEGKSRFLAKRRHKRVLLAGLLVFAVMLGGCAQDGQNAENSGSGTSGQGSGEPLSLTVFQTSANITDQEFQMFVAEPVRKKYPNITMNLIHQTPDNTPEQLVASGSLSDVDMIFGSQASPRVFSDLGAVSDISDLIKKNHVDPAKFDPVSISTIQMYGGGKMLALPLSVKFSLLYYNKDLFDKFAVPYPKDGMTWTEAAQLTKKLTQTSGGVQYEGMVMDANAARIGSQLSLPQVDPKTNRAILTIDGWNRVFEVMKLFQDIPGYDSKLGKNAFLKDRTAAMLVSQAARIGEIEEIYNQGQTLNWGIASLPSFEEAPGKGFEPAIDLLMIPSTAKHREEAFQVMDLLTSDDVQREMGKNGKLSSLKDVKVKETFGQNLKSLQGINVKPILDYTASPEPAYSPYADLTGKPLNTAFNKALSGAADINTALRDAEDEANKAIAAAIAEDGGK